MNTFKRSWRSVNLLPWVLFCAIVGSALLVIFNTHNARRLFHELQILQQQGVKREVEWSQLLLEASAFSSPSLVERKARKELNMQIPEQQHIVAVQN